MLNNSPVFFNYISRKSESKFFAVKLSFLLMLITWLFAFPNVFTFFIQHNFQPSWDTVLLKSKDLTNNLENIAAYSWQAKKIFRLTIPFFIRVFKFSPYVIICFQIVIGFLTYLVSFRLAHRLSGDTVQACLLSSTLAFLYFGRAAFFEHEYLWFDAFSYFFLLMAMYSGKNMLIFIFSVLAAWNDERGFLALSLVFMFHYFEQTSTEKLSLNRILNFNGKILSVMAAIFFYVMLRCFLIYWFDMKSNLSGVGSEFTLNNTLQFLAIGILTFFEGFWLLILLFFGVLWSRRDYLRLLIISLPLIVIIAVAFCVADITRSGAFAVPIIFIIFSYLNNFFTNEELRKILSVCFIFSFLIPPIFVCSDWGLPEWFQKPSFMILVEFIKNRILYG